MTTIDFGYLAEDVRITMEECKLDAVPCRYLGLGKIDADDPNSGWYPMYEIEMEGFIISDLTSSEKLIRCKETGEAGVFNRDAYYNRGGSVAEFYAKNF
tara:strand:+ start:213 stop:509 length:297 start_codon:yes stop_codon:yes gene_type:complete